MKKFLVILASVITASCVYAGGDYIYSPDYIQHLKNKIIWLPFDREDSQFVKVLTENGFKVVYSHIDYGQDFFDYEPEEWDVIISNPPYTNKRRYWERCLDLGKPFTLLLPVNILSDAVINDSLRERERETVARRNFNFSFPRVEQGFTMQKLVRLAISQLSRPHTSQSTFSKNKLY